MFKLESLCRPQLKSPRGLRDPSLTNEMAAWFASVGGHVVVLDNPDDTYARWFAEHDATYALQRPDFHVQGRGHDAAALLADFRTYLQGVPQ